MLVFLDCDTSKPGSTWQYNYVLTLYYMTTDSLSDLSTSAINKGYGCFHWRTSTDWKKLIKGYNGFKGWAFILIVSLTYHFPALLMSFNMLCLYQQQRTTLALGEKYCGAARTSKHHFLAIIFDELSATHCCFTCVVPTDCVFKCQKTESVAYLVGTVCLAILRSISSNRTNHQPLQEPTIQ